MATWKIKRADDSEATFEAYRISACQRQLVNQGVSTVSLTILGDMLGSDPFDDREEIRILCDGAVWFRGYNILSTPAATGQQQSYTITLADIWWYLENTVYMQARTFVDDPDADPTPAGASLTIDDFSTEEDLSSEVLLGDNNGGVEVATDQRIQAVLDYAINSAGINLQVGTIDAGINVGREDAKGITCAEAIKRDLRWTPDQTDWIDYTTDPVTIHFRARSNRSAYEVDIADEETEEVSIAERRDLVLSGVRIEYVRTHERDDFKFRTQDVDEVGTTTGPNALVVPIELYGSYLFNGTIVAAEDVPTGIAQAFYDNRSSAPFEGRVRLAMQDCPDVAWLSKTLNVAGGNVKWASMAADIQGVTDDVFTGRTELVIGPPQHLSIQDLVGLLRAGRTEPPTFEEQLLLEGGGTPSVSRVPQDSPDPRLAFGPVNPPDVILSTHQFVSGGAYLVTDTVNVHPYSGGDWTIGAQDSPLVNGVGTVTTFHGLRVGRGADQQDIPDSTPYPYTGYKISYDATEDATGEWTITSEVV